MLNWLMYGGVGVEFYMRVAGVLLTFSKQLEVMLVVELLVVAVFKMLEEEALNELAETD